jgi:BetI-type transcriptional repressor, C-terminal
MCRYDSGAQGTCFAEARHTSRVPDGRISAKTAARQATRAALLEAATAMLFEAPSADPIGALRPADVVRRTVPPRSNGAFYNIWPTQADFRRDLLHHALSADRIEVGDETSNAAAALLAQPDFSLAETIRVAATLNFEGLKADPALRLKQALWTRHSADPEVRELLAALYDGATAMLVPMYTAALGRAGRRMRGTCTVEQLAVVLTALAEGLHLRWAVQPSAVPDDVGAPPDLERHPDQPESEHPEGEHSPDGAPWTLFASTAYVVITGMTEPIPSP